MSFLGASTNYANRDATTPIVPNWLNDVDRVTYKPSMKTNIGGLTIANFSIDHSTPNGRVAFANTNPMDWAGGPGRMSVNFDMISNSYFAANPIGHVAIVLRQDPATVGTWVRGQGMGFGNATGFTPAFYPNPTCFMETFMGGLEGSGAPGDHYLWPNISLPLDYPMADGVQYHFTIESIVSLNTKRYIRFSIWSYDAVNLQWNLLIDTGDVLDGNVWADLTQSMLAFGQVFESNLVPGWNLAFTNISVTWGPASEALPDQSDELTRYGANMLGSIRFADGQRAIMPFLDAGPSLKAWTAFQSQLTNSGTSVVVKPSGSGTTASFLATNASNPDTVYQAVTYGISAGVALLETFHRGSTNPVFGINVGSGTRIATFSSTGMTLGSLDATAGAFQIGANIKALGAASSVFSDVTAIEGANAYAFANTGGPAFPLENFCVPGAIAGALGIVYSAPNIENAVRPLYCLISVLIGELRAQRGIF